MYEEQLLVALLIQTRAKETKGTSMSRFARQFSTRPAAAAPAPAPVTAPPIAARPPLPARTAPAPRQPIAAAQPRHPQGRMLPPKGLFTGIQEARATGGGSYDRPGRYIQRIDSVEYRKTRKGVDSVIIVKTCLHVFDDAAGLGLRLGAETSDVIGSYYDGWLGLLNQFISGVAGIAEDEVTDEMLEMMLAEDQPIAGSLVIVHCWDVTSQKTQKNITKKRYEGPVSYGELPQYLDPATIERFFPGGLYQQMLAAETAGGQ